MLTKNKKSTISYASRLLVLPLTALIFFAFTLKMKTNNSALYNADKKITVVIDAGHGGDDNGAQSDKGIFEKNLTLSIAKKISALNNNGNINIVLSRDKDENITVKQRVDLASSLHADIFISIHVDAEMNKNIKSGLRILIPNTDNTYSKESKILGSDITGFFKSNYLLPVSNDLKQLERSRSVWVLKANQCASVMIEAGFMSNDKDLQYLTDPKNQETIATNILNGIKKYAQQNLLTRQSNIPVIQDTAGVNKTLKNIPFIGARFADTKKQIWLTADTILYTTEPNKTYVNVIKAVLIVNGKIEKNDILKTKTIQSKKLTIHSGDEEQMLKRYGEVAKNGVFIFENATIIDQPPYYPVTPEAAEKTDDKIFTKVEIEAEFPGGEQAWIK